MRKWDRRSHKGLTCVAQVVEKEVSVSVWSRGRKSHDGLRSKFERDVDDIMISWGGGRVGWDELLGGF